ncbi:hypothetical protein [Salipiger mucosus]|uniref:Uncharacterized protein n=1 Tax=Salipiger mucosus DSM 16094 TaxID=1123237 RepID=S9RJN1_9RHOB|nr:hypothetical protein [Salipiger mucosus]EPX78325.1 hypothetical protein Salmuc_03941 [Salipiger mucosus DSM 16094]
MSRNTWIIVAVVAVLVIVAFASMNMGTEEAMEPEAGTDEAPAAEASE